MSFVKPFGKKPWDAGYTEERGNVYARGSESFKEEQTVSDPCQYVRKEPYPLYINGQFVPSESGETFDILNPVDNRVFATAYRGGLPEVAKAIEAARNAFDEGPWAMMTNKERSRLLLKARDVLAARAEEFTCLEVLDCGKLYPSVRYFELPNAVDGFEYSAGKARCLEGKVVPVGEGGSTFNYVVHQPVGVVAEILPWNGPLMMGCQKISSILAAGNTVVVKPSSWASLSMLSLASVFHEAGFPPGVVNVVTGPGAQVGDALTVSARVDMVSLTGGTETGKHVLSAAAGTVKKLALELGGKSPNLVFDDVDVETAVRWAAFAFTLNSGQVCVAGTRLLLHERIYDQFLESLARHCERLVPGDGFAYRSGVNFQPLISREHAEAVWRFIEEGKREGARLVTGGVPYADPVLAKGNFVPPTVFAEVSPGMKIFQEEIFGPVLCVTRFRTEEEALALANDVRYGLAGAVFTKDLTRAHRVAASIRAGQIYVNTYYSKGMMESPGAGWKESGLGDAGIQKYMHPKTVFVDLNEGSTPPA
jgi:acyl-CoA reductase-like NAD-dependent aldehyde dehydrogenase